MTAIAYYRFGLLLAFSVFLTNRIELMMVLLFAFLVMVRKKSVTFPLKITISMLAVYAISLFASYSVGYDQEKSLQQIILITLFIFCYYQIFNPQIELRRSLSTLFRAYLSVSFVMAVIAVLQIGIYYVFRINIMDYLDINALFVDTQATVNITDYLIRARAFALEAGHLGTLLLPALLYTLWGVCSLFHH